MATKAYDLAVAVGTYTDAQGVQKHRYMNIGAALKTDEGGRFLLIDRAWNPAGTPHDASKGNTVLVAMFEPRKPEDRETATQPAQAPARRETPESPGAAAVRNMFSDDIPF